MEERRFDELTRVLGAATSRRQMLKGVLGGVLAVVVGRAVALSVADAAGVCDRRDCEYKAHELLRQCETNCHNTFGRHGPRHFGGLACTLSCAVGFEQEVHNCRHNATGCFGDMTCCGNRDCANLEVDPFNCGACGHVCKQGQECVSGQCTCADGQTLCNETCVDTETDPSNCGSCGHACGVDIACVDGRCQCDELQTLCNNTCVDTQADSNNCGSCGHVCGDCEQCEGGTCQPLTCDSDRICCQHACYPKCVHNQMNPKTCQCGFCDNLEYGTNCGPTSVCCNYDCVDTSCPDGRQFSDSSCQRVYADYLPEREDARSDDLPVCLHVDHLSSRRIARPGYLPMHRQVRECDLRHLPGLR